jgi:hypothetical protein
MMVGHVTWEGRVPQPDPSQQLPIALSLDLGHGMVRYPVQDTDAGGFFTVSLGILPDGIYTWRVKGPSDLPFGNTTPGFLAAAGTFELTGSNLQTFKLSNPQTAPSNQPIVNVEMGTMRAGDANNDNTVDVIDVNMLRGSFGRPLGTPGYDPRADFDGDGMVDMLDYNVMRSNFGMSGVPPIGP